MDKNKIIAGYARVSTIHQVDKESIPAQKNIITDFCRVHYGAEPELFVDSGFSGKNTERPGLQSLLKLVTAGRVAVLVVFKIDRISRNLIDFSKMMDIFEKAGTKFVSISENFDTSSVVGQSMLKMIMLFAEMERGLTRERVMAVSRDIVARGGHLGGPVPLGYDYDKKTKEFSINEAEARVVKDMFKAAIDGYSTKAISDKLNDDKITSKRGRNWTSTTVHHVLKNEAYKGIYTWNKHTSGRGKVKPKSEWMSVPGVYPVIIPPDEWEAAQDALSVRAHGRGQQRTRRAHLFSGILKCAECGRNLISMRDRMRKSGPPVSIYYCPGHANHWHCTNGAYISDVTIGDAIFQVLYNAYSLETKAPYIKAEEELEAIINVGLSGIVLTNGGQLFQRFIRGAAVSSAKIYKEKEDAAAMAAGIREKKEKVLRAIERLKDLYLYSDSEMTPQEYSAARGKLEKELDKIENKEKEKAAMEKFGVPGAGAIREYIEWHYTNYKDLNSNFDHEKLALFCHDVFNCIVTDRRAVMMIELTNGIMFKFKETK